MYKKTILFFLIACVNCYSQNPKASIYEIRWAIVHPFAALKVKTITKRSSVVSKQSPVKTELDSFNSGGKADAYRHVFFMAAYAQKIKIRKLRKLGIAHEKNNYRQFLRSKTEDGEVPDSLSSVMDLQNNELGFKIGSSAKNLNLERLSELTINKIKNGEAVIVKRDKAGNYLDCDGKKIDLSLYFKKWNVPKCLVAS